MYGLLLQSVQHFIQKDYGEDLWHTVLQAAGIEAQEFTTHTRYNDISLVQLAEACESVIRDGRQSSEFMCYFGKCFVAYFTHYGYDRILRVSGRHFRDFLRGIDNIHETMRFSYPKMISPSFYVEKEDEHGCVLHYRSKRKGFTQYVAGQLEQCAKDFYAIAIDIAVLNEDFHSLTDGCHITYRLNFDNSAFKSQQCQKYQSPSPYSDIQGNFFLKIFPFSVVFNQSLSITHTGPAIRQLFPDHRVIGAHMRTVFRLRRPLMEFTWDNIICMEQVQFELKSLYKAKNKASDTESSVLLKGEMRYMADFNGMVFLCALLISDVDELESLGLYINDLNMYDSSREMVVAGCQHASRLEYSIEKQMDRSRQIEMNLKNLDKEQQRCEALLYSMIPKSTAQRLKNGEDPISTCEVFESVSIMFSYLVGFTDLCHRLPAITLLQCINSVFQNFDTVSDKYDVFKVETLGDAVYMVAGGIPERRPDHAYQVACVAMELLQKIDSVLVPMEADLPQLQIRVGIHTGSVVAGVVGMRMPQYCLFGDTVNTASRMQTYGESGRIHISETTNSCLEGSKLQTFYRGKIHIKGKGEMKTYWLLSQGQELSDTSPVTDLALDATGHIHTKRPIEDFCFRKTDTCIDMNNMKKAKPTKTTNVYSTERSCDQSVKDCFASCIQTQPELDKNTPEQETMEQLENTQLDNEVNSDNDSGSVSGSGSNFLTFAKPEITVQIPEKQNKHVFPNNIISAASEKSDTSMKIPLQKMEEKKQKTMRHSSFSGILQCPFSSLFSSDTYNRDNKVSSKREGNIQQCRDNENPKTEVISSEDYHTTNGHVTMYDEEIDYEKREYGRRKSEQGQWKNTWAQVDSITMSRSNSEHGQKREQGHWKNARTPVDGITMSRSNSEHGQEREQGHQINTGTQVDGITVSGFHTSCQGTQTNLSLIALQENITFCPACGRNGLIKKDKSVSSDS